jgi:LuxR family maltose regulon positive regulatory protein
MRAALIQTKYQWPSIVHNPLARSHLIQRLQAGHQRKLTLVSAPAGYGKSTLVHLWLASSREPVAWLSLDANDNDVGVFLRYLVAAVQSVLPTACQRFAALSDGPQLPPQDYLLQTIAGEVASLTEPLTIVLDDYHVIHNAEIHDLIVTCLKYQTPQLHLVLVTRLDPPFSVTRLRVSEQMTEMRLSDLRFTPDEIHQYLGDLVDSALSAELFNVVIQRTEGWPVGLRLVALALPEKGYQADFVQAIRGTHRYITEYLVDEVLTRQSERVQRFLMYTSILDRFCAPLCDVMLEEIWIDEDGYSSQTILNQLQKANLFLIALDSQARWFRYHHLFQDLLRHRLQAELSAAQIQALHTRVINWLAEHGFLEEALKHALAVKNIAKAVAIFARQRVDLMNETRWQQVEQQLNRFPLGVAGTQPELSMAQVWLLYYRGRWDELPDALEQLGEILAQVELPPETLGQLQGEAETVMALLRFVSGDCDGAITSARIAINQTPQQVWMVRMLAQAVMAVALQANGQLSQAYQSLYQGFEAETTESDLLPATRLALICFIHWIAADLDAMMREAKQSIALSQTSGSQPMLGVGRYHLGAVLYQQNRLAEAEAQFASVNAQPYVYYREHYTYCAIGLALTYQAQNRPDEARAVADQLLGLMLVTSNTTLLPVVEALQAELALRQGRLSTAIRWAKRQPEVPPLGPMFRPYEPHFTLIKVWLKQNTRASRRRATALTTQLIDYLRSIHNTRYLIDALAIQALQLANTGDEAAALMSLEEAVKLAQPGKVIRVFIDLGSEMAAVLTPLTLTDPATQGFIQQILAASHPAVIAPDPSNGNHVNGQLTEPLTQRELEVLTLLMQHQTDQDIAQQLYISLNTVRSHTKHIYAKLNVHNRRQAVQKAAELGLTVTLELEDGSGQC